MGLTLTHLRDTFSDTFSDVFGTVTPGLATNTLTLSTPQGQIVITAPDTRVELT